jgi:hypothetical protein
LAKSLPSRASAFSMTHKIWHEKHHTLTIGHRKSGERSEVGVRSRDAVRSGPEQTDAENFPA